MPRFITNVALAIKGDRVEKGTEIELTAEDAANIDPADITAVESIPAPEPEAEPVVVPVEDMSLAELKDRAKELGLSTAGSKADLQERIALHVPGTEGKEPEEEITNP